MKLEQLLEMGRRVSPPDIDVDWQRLENQVGSGYYAEIDNGEGSEWQINWDPKNPDMLEWFEYEGGRLVGQGKDQAWEVVEMIWGTSY